MLHAPTTKREFIGIYALPGGGKSSVYVSLADWMRRTKSDRKIHILDSDNAWDANRPEDGSLDPYVEVYPLSRTSFDLWRPTARVAAAKVRPGDWLVLDTATRAWDGANRKYWGDISGNDSLAELWIRAEKANMKGGAGQYVSGDHGTNWGVINKFYFEFWNTFADAPCHRLFLAQADTMRTDAKQEVKDFYGGDKGPGLIVKGQRGLAAEPNTLLYAYMKGNGKFSYTTVKERGPLGHPKREYLMDADVTDKGFVPGYLIPVAKWTA